VLLMGEAAFLGFERSVNAWRPPLDRPLATARARSMSDAFQTAWVRALTAVIGAARSALAHPHLAHLELQVRDVRGAVQTVSFSLKPTHLTPQRAVLDDDDPQRVARLEAAQCVAVGEWCALDRALEHLTGPPSLVNCPSAAAAIAAAEAARGGSKEPDAEGAEWLLALSAECWREQRVGEDEGDQAPTAHALADSHARDLEPPAAKPRAEHATKLHAPEGVPKDEVELAHAGRAHV